MKTLVRRNTWLIRQPGSEFGWGNGYIIIPKGHPLHGKDDIEIHNLVPELQIHGGLTFAASASNLTNWKQIKKEDEDGWVVGFDTCHANDNLEDWDKASVLKETKLLKRQLEEVLI